METAAGFAAGLVVMALVCFALALAISAGSLPPSNVVGIRTRWTRASDQAWYAGHRAARPVLRLAGLLSLVAMAALLVLGVARGSSDEGAVVVVGLTAYAVVVVVLWVAVVRANRAARGAAEHGSPYAS